MRMNLIGSPVSRSGWYFKLSCRYAFFISETSAPWHTVTHHNNISEVSEVSRYISINLYSTITVNRQTDTRLASSFSRTTWISRHQKKTILDFNEARDDGVAVASAGPFANHLHLMPDRQPCQHLITQFFTGWMFFLTPNQQYQSTEGNTVTAEPCYIKA